MEFCGPCVGNGFRSYQVMIGILMAYEDRTDYSCYPGGDQTERTWLNQSSTTSYNLEAAGVLCLFRHDYKYKVMAISEKTGTVLLKDVYYRIIL